MLTKAAFVFVVAALLSPQAVVRPRGGATKAAGRHSGAGKGQPAQNPDFELGGLAAYPERQVGPNLLQNAGFEDLDSTTGKPDGWKDNGFSSDTTAAHAGLSSYRITDANQIQYSQYASQTVSLKKGVYRFGGWIRTDNLGAVQGSGVRLCLSSSAGTTCTGVIKGTSDWTYLSRSKIVIPQDMTARLLLQTYAEPDGTAWFDDVELQQETLPLEVFMKYPNYRGVLFDDQSPVARFRVAVTPQDATGVSDYEVRGTVTDELTASVVLRNTLPAAPSLEAEFDLSAMPNGGSYLAKFSLVRKADGSAYEYPAYRITKVPGAARLQMTLAADEHNRLLIRGRPTFLLGVYDAGMPYKPSERAWEELLTGRRLFELPVNFYLNYWYGEAATEYIKLMMNVLERHGILAMTNANCFNATAAEKMAPYWFLNTTEADIRDRAQHPAFAGFYAADECIGELAPGNFGLYQRMKPLDPDGIVLGTLFGDSDLPLWRDSVDLLATDPYPLYGAEPADGYALSKVGDWTRRARESVMDSRPIATVIQFFKATSNSRWPTQQELRNMSYMAIAEGANGLLYWSLGTKALAYVCSGEWCDQRIEYFNRLKAVMEEVKGLGAALTSLDRPELLVANSNPEAIRTRVKYVNRTGYLIAYNSSNAPATATFTWQEPVGSVAVHGESRTLAPAGSSFTDSFGPYEARVYALNSARDPNSAPRPQPPGTSRR